MSGLGKGAILRLSGRMVEFEKLNESHWSEVWAILEPVFRAGETYPYPLDISEAEAKAYWMNPPLDSYAAMKDGAVLGVFYIKPNQPSLGAHVCNCGYVASAKSAGQGIGAQMCEWSQVEARRLGYSAMQYNLVVATNTRAVALWQRLGFDVVGNLPKAFKHAKLGLVDALVMYKEL